MVAAHGNSAKKHKNYEGYFHKGNPDIKYDSKQGKEEEEEEEINNLMSSIRPLNDEELLKACGGRTAHK